MRKVIIAGVASVLMMASASAASAQVRLYAAPDPAAGARSTLKQQEQNPSTDRQALMIQLMEFTLPYLDYQVVHYKDERTGVELATAKRLGLVITFRDTEGNILGMAKRKTQRETAYYDTAGNWLGNRVYQLQTAVKRNIAVRPGDAARQRPLDE